METSIKIFQSVIPRDAGIDIDSFLQYLRASDGNFDTAISAWERVPPVGNGDSKFKPIEEQATHLRFVHDLATVMGNHGDLIKKVIESKPGTTSLRQFTLETNLKDLDEITSVVAPDSHHAGFARLTSASSISLAQTIHRKLFVAEPTAVVAKMVQDQEFSLQSSDHGVVHGILTEDPTFNIRKTPMSKVLDGSAKFAQLPPSQKASVESSLKTLQRVQAIAPVPEAIKPLLDHNITSALQISNFAGDLFVKDFGAVIGDESVASNIHQHAMVSRVRHENFLIGILQTVRGSGIKLIDGGNGAKNLTLRSGTFDSLSQSFKTQVNLETLFGTLDFCDCSDCNSVLSPAAYFVELLEFLRNSNLISGTSHTDPSSIEGTQLQQLLRRRPDLICIQLTCENSNTLIPYIDLALEIMESYVVHAPKITAYNVNGETSNELIAQPQHVNLAAYETLRDWVYPFKLPYSYAIDQQRVYLGFLQTTRAQLLDVFHPNIVDKPSQLSTSQEAVQRAFDAEFNLITQEEYVILTKQGFWREKKKGSSSYILSKPSDAYAKKIRLREPWEYFGYTSESEMTNLQDSPKLGLTWVKAQFLPRTGIVYTDLVTMLKTRYVNPNMPTGAALLTMEKLRFSYRFLSYLVLKKYKNKRQRFANLIRFLNFAQPIIPLIEWAKAKDDPCADNDDDGGDCGCGGQEKKKRNTPFGDEWCDWVYDWFEKIGSVIVLESGEGPMLPVRGELYAERVVENRLLTENLQPSKTAVVQGADPPTPDDPDKLLLGILQLDGSLVDEVGNEAIGFVTVDGTLIDVNTGKNFKDLYPDRDINLYSTGNNSTRNSLLQMSRRLGYIDSESGYLMVRANSDERWHPVRWTPARDTCDIEKVRIMHLDGTSVKPDEYDKMSRFLRLWTKFGWSMPETDEAIVSFGKPNSSSNESTDSSSSSSSSSTSDDDEESYPDDVVDNNPSFQAPEITVNLIHQMVAVKKILVITGLNLDVVLSFWGDIPTSGVGSLYAKTFLTHNLIRLDPVFQPDSNGNFLISEEKMSDHLPILQAALRLKPEDIAVIRQMESLEDSLTLSNVSSLFRFAKLAKFLSVRIPVLPDVLAVFGDPFTDADTTLSLLQTWQNIIDSGFTFPQLNYMIRGIDNLSHPLAPTIPQVLRLTKALFDGLTGIDAQQPDISQADIDNQRVVLADFIPAKLALVYSSDLAVKIANFINGSLQYVTNAPSGLTINATGTLAQKLQYVVQKDAKPPQGKVTVTGIFTADETNEAIGLSSDPRWAGAIARLNKQPVTFYQKNLAALLPTDGTEILMKGDTVDTPPVKGMYFVKYFMPFLRSQLGVQLVQTTVSAAMDLPANITPYLLTAIKATSGQTAMDTLLALKSTGLLDTSGWHGFVIPSQSDAFVFTATSDTQPQAMMLNQKPYPFLHPSEDPSNEWSTDSMTLVAGTLYDVVLSGLTPDALSWSTATSEPSPIPPNALLPALSSAAVSEVLSRLFKTSLLVQGFKLTLDEIVYFHDHPSDFASAADNKPLQIDSISIGCWKRLRAYSKLRDTIPKQPTRLIDLFDWTSRPDSKDIVAEITKVTIWDASKLRQILTAYKVIDNLSSFKNETVLCQVQTALELATKVAIDVPLLFEWAKPLTVSDESYQKLTTQAETLKNIIRAKYNADDWETAVKPLNDTLRKNRRDALVAYLLVEESLVKTGLIKDADSLFEYFLIDCQMSSCLQTSRIKQATSSIQLYIQRILLGLEDEVGTTDADRVSRERWDWMKRYRVWEAHRQIFLYPENWLDPTLRDDKTELFLDLESQLQQKDVSLTSAADSLKLYLYSVSAVANLKASGLFVIDDDKTLPIGVNVVARRMNAPYDWYSRQYTQASFWTPWTKMPVDIPNYDVVDESTGVPMASGSYVAPFLWQGRPILFFLQMAAKHFQHQDSSNRALGDRFANDDQQSNEPKPIWEIRLGYSLFQNGKWTQKNVSQSTLQDSESVKVWDPKTTSSDNEGDWKKIDSWQQPNQARYQVIPRIVPKASPTQPELVYVDVVYRNTILDPLDGEHKNTLDLNRNVGYFIFVEGAPSHTANQGGGGSSVGQFTTFHYTNSLQIFSFQAVDPTSAPNYFGSNPSISYPQDVTVSSKSVVRVTGTKDVVFNHTFVDPLLKHTDTSTDPTKALTGIYSQFASLAKAAHDNGDNPFGLTDDDNFNEQMSPYSIYNTEFGLHAPMILMDKLLQAQQFDAALAVAHTVFDPSSPDGTIGTSNDNSVYWKFLPFKGIANTDAKETLESMFLSLQPETADPAITEWRDKPFKPHAVARMRPTAYMKWIAMKYIEILLAYGDYYFRQNSLETIPEAIQCYILASHVYGPRGQKIPSRGKKKPQTYASLLNRWDAFGNAVVQLEVEFPFSNQTSLPIGSSNGITGFANVFGFATSLYFCIPNNPKLVKLRDTIDDRLFKIRNCMDINGVVRHLPLQDLPIDPGLLVQATAQGLSLDTVLNDMSGPIPNYRFNLLLQKAIELCGELKSLGGGLLAAKEKKDTEHMSVLRASHETIINNLLLDMKERQLNEANGALDQLLHSRLSPSYRLQFYKSLVGLTDAAPGEGDDFNEIANSSLEAPTADGQLMLITPEKEESDKALAAQNWGIGIGILETLAGIFHMFPDTEIDIKPFGVGTGLKWGGSFLGGATGAVARGLQIYGTYLTSSSANAGRKGQLLRALQDRIFQANTIGLELKNIDKQIAIQRIRVTTADQERKNQQTQLDQITAVEDFLRSKYTTEELYSWMESQTSLLYQQTYNLAYDLAKRAEKAFKFERPQSTTQYVQMGYWNNARDGLLAGEKLFYSLKLLESAYQEDLGHDFEMVKHVSLRQWAPMALLEFRETGSIELSLPEMIFDMDCPGHYMRRIVSLSVTIPCVLGPYSSVNCTIRLLSHTIRVSPRASSKGDYPQDPENEDDRFSVLNVPITSVALSSAQNDAGRHEATLTDRYNAFEGAGVISTWRFELPPSFRSFDYSTMSDVIMHIKYTSMDGGDKLKTIASDTVADYIKTVQDESTSGPGISTVFDLKSDFASEWYSSFRASSTNAARQLKMSNLSGRLPAFSRMTKPERIMATSVMLVIRGTLQPANVQIALADDDSQTIGFKPSSTIKGAVGEGLTAVISDGGTLPMTNWVLNITGNSTAVEGIWLVATYALT